MLNGLHQVADRMLVGRFTQVVRGRMKVDLRAGHLLVTQEVANGDDVDALVHEVRGERVSQTVWRYALPDLGTMSPGTNTLIDRTA